jgi:poly-gamma-glutamate synthesis protein (capsule biosynthesis protein)
LSFSLSGIIGLEIEARAATFGSPQWQKRLKMKTTKRIVPLISLIILAALALSACSGALNASLSGADLPKGTDNPSAAEAATQIPTATPEPVNLHLSDALPVGIVDEDALASFTLSSDPAADLWAGPAAVAPEGEVLQESVWVYGLAAPFPTLTDSVALADLQAYWSGDRPEALANITQLYLPAALAVTWEASLGEADPAQVTVYESLPEAEVLWEQNAWSVLPFDELTPELKVIAVDGITPLPRDFDPATAPLVVRLQLVATTDAARSISEADRQALTAAFTPTNRDPEKLTTLVMTGVTALVRATANKMEINGVLYPAEEIVDWLLEADLTHISNEVSFYEDCPAPDPFSRLLYFCSSPKYIELFDYIDADIIELTGNHNNDSKEMFGVDVVPFSLDLYAEHGMDYYGGGLDLEDAMSPLTITDHGNKLAFIGCNSLGPLHAWATEEHGGAAPCGDYQWMADEISRLRAEGYLPIATFQYAEDYSNLPGEHHVRDFGMMADAGAIIVNGSQAHRAKAMTFRNGAFVDYGLGNLFFDQMGVVDAFGNYIPETRWEIIQRHTFYDGQYLSTELLTAMLEDYAQPRPMTETERATFLTSLFEASGWETR